MKHHFAPRWNFAIEGETTAATSKTIAECMESTANMLESDSGIGIDENKDIAAGRSCAGIPRGRNLPTFDRNHARAELLANRCGCVGRSIVHHDNLVFVASGRGMDRAKGPGQLSFFVKGRDNERNHGSAINHTTEITEVFFFLECGSWE